ncbi:MAG: putative zinc metalloprotease Rip3 [Acidimicrobiia bacterium]|nr:MAG: putative zinc metalloprotease Rip3 [Acidimicrobiia bacterium]
MAMLRPTLRLGRVAGIEVGVHWSLLVIGVLLAGTLAGGLLPSLVPDAGGSYWAAAILATGLFFASILGHELAHALVAIRRGQRVEGITLWLMGGVARLRDEAKDAKSELLVALAGPGASVALGTGFLALAFALDAVLASGSLLPAVAYYLGAVNLLLAAFNMLPGAPLDGGRVLAGLLWLWRKDRRRAQITAARAGRGVGLLLVAVPVVQLMTGGGLNLWLALVGWFVIDASRAEEEQARVARRMDDRTLRDLLTVPQPTAPAWTTVAELRDTHPDGATVVLTDFSGLPAAVVTTPVPAHVPAWVRARDVAAPLDTLPKLPARAPALSALHEGIPVVVVDDDGRVLGAVGFAELRRADVFGPDGATNAVA